MAQHHRPPTSHPARPPVRRTLRSAPAAAIVVAAVAALLAACGSSPAASNGTSSGTGSNAGTGTSSSAGDTVKTASTSLGTILETGSGMALYTYGPDHGGTTNECTGTCLQAWPPLTVPSGSTPKAGSGVTGTLGTVRQSNGTEWVTYDGNLLYTFLSEQPGQVTGNGVAGFSVAKVTTSGSGSGTTTTSSGGYGY